MFLNKSGLVRISNLMIHRNLAGFRRPHKVLDDQGKNLLKDDSIRPIDKLNTIYKERAEMNSSSLDFSLHKRREASQNYDKTSNDDEEIGESPKDDHSHERKKSFPRFNKVSKKESLKRKMFKIEQSLSTNYDLVKTFIQLNNNRNLINNSPLAILEGERLIADALLSGVNFKGIYHVNSKQLSSFKIVSKALETRTDVKVEKVLDSDLKLTSSLVTPSGVVAIISKPNYNDIDKWRSSLPNNKLVPVTLIAAGIKDPTNMGGLIRTAAAAGIQEIVTSFDSVHVWEGKVVRTGAGAHFKIPISEAIELNALKQRLEYADSIICCETRGGVDFDKAPINSSSTNCVLIIGNEASGVPQELSELLTSSSLKDKTTSVSIPMSNGVESLNSYVAGSILLYHIRKIFCNN